MIGEPLHLDGQWLASDDVDRYGRSFASAGCDVSNFRPIAVPGHWRDQPAFSSTAGPLLYRRTFTPEHLEEGRRWLTIDGVWDKASAWLGGHYVGEVEGYFAPKSFDITRQLRVGREEVVALEVSTRESPWPGAGGLWGGVHIDRTGPVRVSRCRITCTEANNERAILSMATELDVLDVDGVRVQTTVTTTDGRPLSSSAFTRAVANGNNRVKWTVIVEDAPLWWPWTHGEQPMVDITVEVSVNGELSDRHEVRAGLRHVARHNGFLFVNGERLHVRGVAVSAPLTPLGPTAEVPLVGEARAAGANLLDVGPWVERPPFYAEADRLGMLILQGLPRLDGAERAAARLGRQAIEVLGHHPSIVAWSRPAPILTLLSRLARRRPEEHDPNDSSRPLLDTIEPWDFDKTGDEAVAALIGKWSRGTKLVRFRTTDEEVHPVVEQLRRLKYQPLGGFVVDGVPPERLGDALEPLSLSLRHMTDPQPGRVWHAEVLVVNDLPSRLDDMVVVARVDVDGKHHEWKWDGNAPADSVVAAGRFRLVVPLAARSLAATIEVTSPDFRASRQMNISLV